MELRRLLLDAEILDPTQGFAPRRSEVEVRWDPLTGLTSRVLGTPRGLMPPSDEDLEAIGRHFAPTCPFCADRLESQTPRFPPTRSPEGRIRRGEAVLFPNLFAYSQFSSVSVYSADLHYLPLERMTPCCVGGIASVLLALTGARLEVPSLARLRDPARGRAA